MDSKNVQAVNGKNMNNLTDLFLIMNNAQIYFLTVTKPGLVWYLVFLYHFSHFKGKLLCLHYNVFQAKESMDKAILVLEKCFELMEKKSDDKLLGSLYYAFAETLVKNLDESTKVKAGQSFQMAFKLNPRTMEKITKQFSRISDFNISRLFKLSRLIEYSPLLKEVIEKIAGNIEEFSIISGQVQWGVLSVIINMLYFLCVDN